ncbi:MAG: hypothetical protein JO263_03015 [Candidatus Eremiobacteraeota bacterium]|nr:hypothetical protein [Candidatus Eremiobacteraeota bacterium]
MENVHAERSAGWAVLCYVGIVVIATLVTSGLPSVQARPANAALAIDVRHVPVLIAVWLTFPAAGFFLWFLVGLRTYLTSAPEGRQEGLPTLAMLAGVVMVAGSLIAASFETVAVYAPPDTFAHQGLSGMYDAFIFTQGCLGYAPVSIFLFAAAHSMRRHESAPGWLASLGYVAAVGAGLATLSIFFSGPPLGPGEIGSGIVGALPTGVWLICTGLVLIQSKRGSSGGVSSTSAAS